MNNFEHYLGRMPINLYCEGISEFLKDKTVLVTGGGGSIGSELCRQISDYNPGLLLILDIYENNAYDIYNDIKFKNKDFPVKIIIASITDRETMEDIFAEFCPDIVFHAAAHKHVPLMESNPNEAIKNNVFGTLNIAECAGMTGTQKFVMISSDKAVNPANIMGASKRICEMIMQMMNAESNTEFIAVRFGNVIGSNGSVIPLFKKQIEKGGPVTVTDPFVTRYFMTVNEAVHLVLRAGMYAKGSEIFVLDMGKPVKIYDLACGLIKLSGYELNKDIEIEIIGLRPGEKLYEEITTDDEDLIKTNHEKILIAKSPQINIDKFKKHLIELKNLVNNSTREELYLKIKEIVPTYKPANLHYSNSRCLLF